jgi:DNA-binding winged helix-turn-helix (wHTH) protein/tetratricopeptide (TPR) repeat protein
VHTPLGSLFRFGPFQVNSLSGELWKNGNRVKLQEQPFRLLVILLENAGEVVTHDDLCHRIWHDDTFVDFDGSLRVAVRKLREALGDDAENPRYVETIPKRGYRFLAPEIYPELATRGIGELGASPLSAQIAAPDGGRIGEPLVHRSNWSRRWLLTFVLLLIVVAGIAIAVRILRHPKVLTEKDTVVLADFANSTGDPVFDGTLRQGLSVQPEQSPFLSMVSEGRIQQTLKMMGQPADARLTPGMARELCQRMGSAAVLNGSIAQIGTRYLLTLQAVNCSNGDSLASTEAQASGKNDVLDTLGKTASEMRNKLGESLGTVRKFDTPLEQATTTSLEALKAYSLGRKASAGSEWAAAVPFYQRAIRLDPNFSMAYARLGNCYRLMGEPTLAAENTRKAYELREHVSELEKFYIESHYYQATTGELEKASQVYELWAQSYPRDWGRPSAEAAVSSMLGQYDKELIESREELRLNHSGGGYMDLLDSYLSLNHLTEAQSTFEEAEAKKFDSPSIRYYAYELRFLQNDAAGMSQQVAWATGKLGVEDTFLGLEANTAAYSGRLGQARDLSRQAVVSAKRAEEPERVAEYEAEAALREALFENPAEARERAADALGLSNSSSVQSLAALALAFAGDAVRARTLADDLANRFPDHTIVQSYKVPTIRAQLALSHDDPSGAIEILQAAVPYELSGEGALYPVYVRGKAYLAAHKGNEAAAEFQKIHDHSGIVVNAPIGALAHLGLGRAYALSGDKIKAKSAYRDFLTIWKDADPDIPILKQAKAEYAKLQ